MKILVLGDIGTRGVVFLVFESGKTSRNNHPAQCSGSSDRVGVGLRIEGHYDYQIHGSGEVYGTRVEVEAGF